MIKYTFGDNIFECTDVLRGGLTKTTGEEAIKQIIE